MPTRIEYDSRKIPPPNRRPSPQHIFNQKTPAPRPRGIVSQALAFPYVHDSFLSNRAGLQIAVAANRIGSRKQTRPYKSQSPSNPATPTAPRRRHPPRECPQSDRYMKMLTQFLAKSRHDVFHSPPVVSKGAAAPPEKQPPASIESSGLPEDSSARGRQYQHDRIRRFHPFGASTANATTKPASAARHELCACIQHRPSHPPSYANPTIYPFLPYFVFRAFFFPLNC